MTQLLKLSYRLQHKTLVLKSCLVGFSSNVNGKGFSLELIPNKVINLITQTPPEHLSVKSADMFWSKQALLKENPFGSPCGRLQRIVAKTFWNPSIIFTQSVHLLQEYISSQREMLERQVSSWFLSSLLLLGSPQWPKRVGWWKVLPLGPFFQYRKKTFRLGTVGLCCGLFWPSHEEAGIRV